MRSLNSSGGEIVVVVYGNRRYNFSLTITWREAKQIICSAFLCNEAESSIEDELGEVDPDDIVGNCVGDAILKGVPLSDEEGNPHTFSIRSAVTVSE